MAKSVMAALEARGAGEFGTIADRAELSLLGTTVAKLEELLGVVDEYHDLLVRQLERTTARIG
ncbi:MAG: hypothetical protein ABI702_00430 [Burkholderiales bacterium]